MLQLGADIHPQSHRLAVDEMLARDVLQAIQVAVVDAVHVARVPARVVKRGASPPMGEHEGSNALVADRPYLVEIRQDRVEAQASLGDEMFVIGPSALLLAHVVCELPVVVSGVVAQHVADTTPIEEPRRRPDYVEVDIHPLRDGPAEGDGLAAGSQQRSVAERGVRRHRSWCLEKWCPPGP